MISPLKSNSHAKAKTMSTFVRYAPMAVVILAFPWFITWLLGHSPTPIYMYAYLAYLGAWCAAVWHSLRDF